MHQRYLTNKKGAFSLLGEISMKPKRGKSNIEIKVK